MARPLLPTRREQQIAVAPRAYSTRRVAPDGLNRRRLIGVELCRKARVLATRVVPAGRVRQNRGVRVERNRENGFTLTATGQELSALVAGARLALDAMRASADAPPTAIELLARVLDDFDRSRERLAEPPPNGDRR